MRTGVIAYKMGMTHIFDENNKHVPVTVLKVDNCVVTDVKTVAKNGYTSVQLGAGIAKENKISKPLKGHLKKSGATPKTIHEFRVSEDCLLNVGDVVLPSTFIKGQYVDVSGKSIGKGYAGGMKRWNFRGLEATHGVSVSHRSVGGTGQNQDPGKVFKGKKMPGHLGDENVTIQNLLVVEANDDEGYILVRGAVPGATGSVVYVSDAVKSKLPAEAPIPAVVKSSKPSVNADAPAEAKAEESTDNISEIKE
ncbi:50S ribosomal protein L3 [bacterium]|nr:50S ribosomal protein L3 [bacterium]